MAVLPGICAYSDEKKILKNSARSCTVGFSFINIQASDSSQMDDGIREDDWFAGKRQSLRRWRIGQKDKSFSF
jgi:hypothetical protein